MLQNTLTDTNQLMHEQSFKTNQHINIASAFTDEFAQRMTLALESHKNYSLATFVNNQVLNLPTEQYRNFSDAQQQQLFKMINHNAAHGIGYCYKRSSLEGAQHQKPDFKVFSEWLNNEQILDWVKRISGYNDICAASLQASCFEPGHFLTRHNDIHKTEQRRVAFVANFNREWHPDWGGLLQFYSQAGAPLQSWAPFYNSLNLFSVDRIHSVTYVTPFAKQSRYAFSGWFRAKPL